MIKPPAGDWVLYLENDYITLIYVFHNFMYFTETMNRGSPIRKSMQRILHDCPCMTGSDLTIEKVCMKICSSILDCRVHSFFTEHANFKDITLYFYFIQIIRILLACAILTMIIIWWSWSSTNLYSRFHIDELLVCIIIIEDLFVCWNSVF